jgi:ubiquinone/menaquinone biosynthesis C-methylase UbiE
MESVHEHLIGAYDRAAPTYDSAGVSHFSPFGEPLVELARVGEGDRVLDLGCGAGATLLPAARRVGEHGEVIGIDLAPRMVARTRMAIRDAGLANARAEEMDAAALEFEDGSFDAVLCGFGLTALADPDAALAEARRVLRPDGAFAVSVWDNLLDRRWLWEGELILAVADQVPAELLQTIGSMVGRFNDEDKVRTELEVAGFEDMAVATRDIERTFDSAEAWWEWSWSHGSRALLEAMPDDVRERFRSEGFARLEGAGRRARTRVFVALLATARRPG